MMIQEDDLAITQETETLELWIFPALQKPIIENLLLAGDISKSEPQENKEDVELEQLKQDLRNNIALFTTINDKFRQIVNQIDSDLLLQLISLIKKITQKIIAKQLDVDTTTMQTMINEAVKQIVGGQHCELFLAPENYKQLANDIEQPLEIPMYEDETLKPGDFRIIMPTGEITGILEQRINAIFGLLP